MKKIPHLIIATLCLISWVVSSEIDTLESRLYKEAMVSAVNAAEADTQVQGILDKMYSNGKFRDVNYSTTSNYAPAGEHLNRLKTLAKALDHPGSSWNNSEVLKERLFASIKYWVDLNLQNNNWWHRYIGYPRNLYRSVMIAHRYMGPNEAALKRKVSNYLTWGWNRGCNCHHSGANLTDLAYNALAGAVIGRDSSLIKQISVRIEKSHGIRHRCWNPR